MSLELQQHQPQDLLASNQDQDQQLQLSQHLILHIPFVVPELIGNQLHLCVFQVLLEDQALLSLPQHLLLVILILVLAQLEVHGTE